MQAAIEEGTSGHMKEVAVGIDSNWKRLKEKAVRESSRKRL